MPKRPCNWESSDGEYKCTPMRATRGDHSSWNACIFHLTPDQKNDADHPGLVRSFKDEFAGLLDAGETNCRGIRFPPGIDMSQFDCVDGEPRMHPEEYYEATEGDLLDGADTPALDFREAEFQEADFSGAVLPSECDFSKATFERCDFEAVVIGAEGVIVYLHEITPKTFSSVGRLVLA